MNMSLQGWGLRGGLRGIYVTREKFDIFTWKLITNYVDMYMDELIKMRPITCI